MVWTWKKDAKGGVTNWVMLWLLANLNAVFIKRFPTTVYRNGSIFQVVSVK